MSGDAVTSPGSEQPARRRGVRLSPDEAWSVVEAAHTGILGTLRRDGVPVMLPIWFVVLDRRIYVRTGADSKKAQRIRRDQRASFLVESGERWAELCAVHLTGTIRQLDQDDPLAERVAADFDEKYAAFRTASTEMGSATRAYYARPRAVFEFTPDDRIVSWDNHLLGLA